jgi:hypothetical protein
MFDTSYATELSRMEMLRQELLQEAAASRLARMATTL